MGVMFLRDCPIGSDDGVRYGKNFRAAFGALAEVIWFRGEPDYSGTCSALVRLARQYKVENDVFVMLDWRWGSCSGCDEWESRGLSNREISLIMYYASARLDRGEMAKLLGASTQAEDQSSDICQARVAFVAWEADNPDPCALHPADKFRCNKCGCMKSADLPMFSIRRCRCEKTKKAVL